MMHQFTLLSGILINKVRYFTTTLLVTLALVTTCFAQTTTPTPPVRNDLIPPAPTAAALGKYGDVPVSLYAGKPQISIPLGEVASGKLHLPLALNYNAGGIRVEEIASWVGIGWSLDAGGVITRSVRGLPDDSPNGFFNKAAGAIPDPPVYSSANYSQFHSYESGQYDSQPDLYYFNVAGRTGKFIQNQDRQIQITPYQKLKIETIPSNGGDRAWQLTTEDGTRYLFKHIEYSAASSNTFGGTNSASGGAYYASSWFLSDIISPTNERIQFQYSDYNMAAYPVASSETKYYRVGGPSGMQTVSDNITYNSTILSQGKHLSKILFPNGEVEFVLGAGRCDLLGDRFLQKIIFRRTTPQTQVLREYWLDYKYLQGSSLVAASDCAGMTDVNNQSAERRLFLTTVQERNGAEQKPPHQLEYWLGDGTLPPRSVISGSYAGAYYSQDHWGYFNGRNTNTTLVPAMTTSDGIDLPGADRSPVLTYARLGSLKTITYPTGGRTTFEWELHDFTMPAGTNPVFTPPTRAMQWKYDSYISAQPVTPILINNVFRDVTATVSYSFPCTCTGMDAFSLSGGCQVALLLYRKSDNKQVYSFSCRSTENNNLVYTFHLDNGEYYFTTYHSIPRATPPQSVPDPVRPYTLTLDWKETIVTGTEPTPSPTTTATNFGGGLRIAQITDTDPASGQSYVKVYEYKGADGTSSGKLVSLPSYTFPYREVISALVGATTNTTVQYTNDFVVRNSNSQAALGTTQGSPVGYANVTVYYGQQGSTKGINGKTEYAYTNSSSNPDWQEGGTDPRFITPVYPYAPADSKDWQRGLLLQQGEYRRSGTDYVPVKNIRNTYNFYNAEDQANPNPNVANKYVLGVKVGAATKFYYAENSSGWNFQDRTSSNIAPAYAFFKARQGYSELASTATTLYDQNDVTKATTTKTTYTYSLGNLQPQELVQTASNQDVLRTTFKYPSDFVITGTPSADEVVTLQRMQQLNMLSPVVEKQVWTQPAGTLGWRLLQGELTKFTSLTVPTSSAPNPITVVPAQWWILNTLIPLLTPVTTTVSNGALTYDPAYTRKQDWSYDPATANVVSSRRANDVPTSYLWGYQQTLPIAEVKNATADQIAFTSFEADSPGGWTYDAGSYVSTALTGSRGYGLGGGGATVQRTGLPAGVYELHLWAHGTGVPQITGPTQQQHEDGNVQGYWHQHRYYVTLPANATLQIATPGYIWIDDVRLYPVGAQMTTYTHDPLTGVTSTSDASNQPTYYEYDGLGRLKLVRDTQGNIRQQQQYHYKP
jgi:YD repeat-containing protein